MDEGEEDSDMSQLQHSVQPNSVVSFWSSALVQKSVLLTDGNEDTLISIFYETL